jgi:hypothetical protein
MPLYLTLPDNVSDCCGLNRGVKYRIKKYLYGLPDAGLAYYKAYSAHLASGGYVRTTSDPCLFVKADGKERTYVWCHVDDTFVCSTVKTELILFQEHVKAKFDITIVDNVTEYLGIRITELKNGSCVDV